MRARSWAPTFSIECVRSAFSSLEYLRRPFLFSAIHWRAICNRAILSRAILSRAFRPRAFRALAPRIRRDDAAVLG